MSLDHYRLLTQLGAGPDGASYRAQSCHDGSAVEIRILSGARSDAERWPRLCKRLRLAALLEHSAAVRIRELGIDQEPPFIALELVERECLADDLQGRLPLQQMEALGLVYQLAKAVAAAHRIGLVHGRLLPSHILNISAQGLKLDFTNTTTAADDGNFRELDLSCQAPEYAAASDASPPMDIFGLGAILSWFVQGHVLFTNTGPGASSQTIRPTLLIEQQQQASDSGAVDRLLVAMLADDPSKRPTITEVEAQLSALLGLPASTGEFVSGSDHVTVAGDPRSAADVSSDEFMARERLGRFRLLHKLGQGGMGAVYRAEDVTDGTPVAIKVLRADWAKRDVALRRFHKEARLLAEVNNPYVANLLEVNEDGGIHYLAMEFVEGRTLGNMLDESGQLSESVALGILADVARALIDAHERGIVHRDIKPDNILLVSRPAKADLRATDAYTPPTKNSGLSTEYSVPGAPPFTADHSPRVKLTDFGLARHVVESESLNMTQAGAILGTPYYMAPEQCTGTGTIAPPTDIYAMGATLFHLLAGRPPFMGDSQFGVIAKHCNEAPPNLKTVNAAVSDAVCQIVEKCLAKAPEARYANAGVLLRDLERVIRGEPTSIVAHPRPPDCDASKVLRYDWTWELEASPQQLWPHVSNTERLNRACGLPAVQFTAQSDGKGVRRFGKIRKLGLTAAWQEHPFEWIEARRFGVLREFQQGPFKWLVSMVELTPRAGGGTTLAHRVRIEPNGMIGRTAAALEVRVKGYRAVDSVYRRIDAAITGKLGGQGLADPFEEPSALSGPRRRRLDQLLDKLNECSVDPGVVERFGDFLAAAPAQEVARIRPIALARRLALDPEQVVAACLHGAREGLLVLLWDILCPLCRIPSEVKNTLKALRDHGRCEACNLDFELDFGNSVEMIFRAHPEIRDTELGIYCIGGPAHSPHVIAQVRVGPSERIELDLALPEGAYRMRGPQLPYVIEFRVQPGAGPAHWDLNLGRGPDPDLPRTLKAGRQVFALTNDHPQELVARVERAAPREDALTAARASTLALFRELFPGEILSPGQLVSVANVTLLVTDLEQAGRLYQELGDARAFGLIHEHFRLLDECIRREGGALVKVVGDGVLASFSETVAAVRAGLEMHAALARRETTKHLRLRVGIHRGPAMAATLNDHLDYFGSTVNLSTQLPQQARGGEIVLTQVVAADPAVSALLHSRGAKSEIIPAEANEQAGRLLHRVLAAERNL